MALRRALPDSVVLTTRELRELPRFGEAGVTVSGIIFQRTRVSFVAGKDPWLTAGKRGRWRVGLGPNYGETTLSLRGFGLR
jgi:hypothetical protein